jgi:CRISPR system Cascade subunit CasB
MSKLETLPAESPRTDEAENTESAGVIGKLAGWIDRADPGTHAALTRLDPDAMRPHQMAALSRALIGAGLSPENWRPATWKQWALIAHGMALAGHGKGSLGKQFAEAGVTEARVTKLLVSRGDAFLQIVPRLLRLLASKQVRPNWYTFGDLIRHNDAQHTNEQEKAEALRLHIAGHYFSAMNRNAT